MTLHLIKPDPAIHLATLHHQVIESLPNQNPRWLIDGSLFDHKWVVATDDTRLKRGARRTIDHDVAVGYGRIRLSAPQREADLVTSKLLAYHLLEPPASLSAIVTDNRIRYLHHLMRWRDRQGLYRMEDLTSDEFFIRFCQDLRFGFTGLIDGNMLVSRYIADVESGAAIVPIRDDTFGPCAAHDAIAEYLGISGLTALPKSARRLLLGFLSARGELGVDGKGSLQRMKAESEQVAPLMTQNQMTDVLCVWADLWELRQVAAHDPVDINPFAERSVRQRVQEFTDRTSQRTKTVPQEQVCFLIDRALRWVFDYSPAIMDTLSKIKGKAEELSLADGGSVRRRRHISRVLADFDLSGPGTPTEIYREALYVRGTASRKGAVSFHDIVFKFLPTACAIVLATFTARRKEEIESLQADCIERDADGEPWLVTWIEKTLRDLDRIPVPESVVKAVELLTELSSHARAASGSDWLFAYQAPGFGTGMTYQLRYGLRDFVALVDVPALPDGSRWEFAPHQFRRFFAIVYYHRFRHASLTALTAFLKHFNPEMTRQYITEATRGVLARVREEADAATMRLKEGKVSEAEAESTLQSLKGAQRAIVARADDFEHGRIEAEFERLFAVAVGEDGMGGHGGERLKQDLDRLIVAALQQVELVPDADEEEVFNDLLYDFAKMHFLEPHPDGHSYCSCGRKESDISSAECLVEKARVEGKSAVVGTTRPDYAYAPPETCSRCPHNVQMDENRDAWEGRLLACLGQSQRAMTDFAAAAHREQAEICRGHLRRCFDEAPPMPRLLREVRRG